MRTISTRTRVDYPLHHWMMDASISSVPSNHLLGIVSVFPPKTSTPHLPYNPGKVGSQSLEAAEDSREEWAVLFAVRRNASRTQGR